jgi:hypothetical protein
MTAQNVRKIDPSQIITAKPDTAWVQLLGAHIAHPTGLTDEEAASLCEVSMLSEYATRCSELTRNGLLMETSKKRQGRNGIPRVVRKVSPIGISMWIARINA